MSGKMIEWEQKAGSKDQKLMRDDLIKSMTFPGHVKEKTSWAKRIQMKGRDTDNLSDLTSEKVNMSQLESKGHSWVVT